MLARCSGMSGLVVALAAIPASRAARRSAARSPENHVPGLTTESRKPEQPVRPVAATRVRIIVLRIPGPLPLILALASVLHPRGVQAQGGVRGAGPFGPRGLPEEGKLA